MLCNDLPTELFARFLLDLSLIELNLQRFTPSTLVFGALVTAWKKINSNELYSSLGCGPNGSMLEQLIRHESIDNQILTCAGEMENLLVQFKERKGLVLVNSLRVKYEHVGFCSIHPLIGIPFNSQTAAA